MAVENGGSFVGGGMVGTDLVMGEDAMIPASNIPTKKLAAFIKRLVIQIGRFARFCLLRIEIKMASKTTANTSDARMVRLAGRPWMITFLP